MRVIEPGGKLERPSAVTIGKFDGVHLGHKALLEHTRRLADAMGGEAGVLTFDRHPLEFLRPGTAPACLTPMEERLNLLEATRTDFCVLLRLDSGILSWPPEDFVNRAIVQPGSIRHIVTGEDFRYGLNREGDINALRSSGTTAGFDVHTVSDVLVDGNRVSSYAIRNALTSGNLGLTERMLGRRFALTGTVVEGRRLGRTIGYPTANVSLSPGIVVPANGVYAVTIDWGDGAHSGAASIGVRPTVEDGPAPRWLEVYVLDWNGDLYGRKATVSFVKRLRAELRFDSLNSLKDQIALDVEAVRAALGK